MDAHATTVDECDGLITGDQEALGGVIIGGNNAERSKTGLESKLSGASKKLGQAKFTDSIQKLVDFNSTVYDLSQPNRKGETKMDPDDATSLTDGANDAINATVSVDVINDNKPEYSNRCSNKVVFSSGELDALCD